MPSNTQSAYVGLLLSMILYGASCTKSHGNSNNPPENPPGSSEDPVNIADTSFKPFAHGSTTMDYLIGINGLHEEGPDEMQAGGVFRAYCNWDWFEGDNPGDLLRFQYSRSGWYFDDAFRGFKRKDMKVIMCFQGAIKNLQGFGNMKFNDKPTDKKGLNTTDPKSYTAISNTLYQIAARYGKTRVEANKLNSDDKLTGLDLIDYIEVWNEPDKDWEGDDAKFSPEEYAAMLSICYDKIKAADPNMKVAMAGLATLSVDYTARMKAWFEAHREDKKFAADVVNMHVYAFNNKIVFGKTWPWFGPAETPEDARFREKSAELVDYCKKNIPGAETWISEFGWDTNPQSVLSPKKVEGVTVKEMQGRWIARAFLDFAAAGITKAQVFQLVDVSQDYDNTWFATAGLIDRTLNFTKKPAWYYTFTLKNSLKNMVFIGEEKASDNSVIIYKFRDINSNKGAYAVWLNSSDNLILKNYKLTVSNYVSNADKVELTNESVTGTKTNLSVVSNKVEIDVTEKPLIINVNFIR